MPNSQHVWMGRIKAVEREFEAAHFAIDWVLNIVQSDPTVLEGKLRPNDIRIAREQMEATYMVRLFAEFETALRDYWATKKVTHPPVRDLLESLAGSRSVSKDALKNAHAVREFRNALVHERQDAPDAISLAQARHHLCTFVSFLPRKW